MNYTAENLIPVPTSEVSEGMLAFKVGPHAFVPLIQGSKISVNGITPDQDNNIIVPQYNSIENNNSNLSITTESTSSQMVVYSVPLTSLNIEHNTENTHDFTIIFSTSSNFTGFSLILTQDCYVNKELSLEADKRYIICFDKDTILWSELTQYQG